MGEGVSHVTDANAVQGEGDAIVKSPTERGRSHSTEIIYSVSWTHLQTDRCMGHWKATEGYVMYNI